MQNFRAKKKRINMHDRIRAFLYNLIISLILLLIPKKQPYKKSRIIIYSSRYLKKKTHAFMGG